MHPAPLQCLGSYNCQLVSNQGKVSPDLTGISSTEISVSAVHGT